MSGFSVFPQPVATNRMVLKQNTAGQVLLPSSNSPVTANTSSSALGFGAWVEITSSTSVEYYITGTVAFIDASNTVVGVNAPLYVDIGMGGAGSETSLSLVAIASSMGRFGNTNPGFAQGGHQLLDVPVRVAAGTRLAVRTALWSPASTGRSCTVYLIAVPYSAVEGN